MDTTPPCDAVTLLGRAVGDEQVAAYLRCHSETVPLFEHGVAYYGAGFGMDGFSLSARVASNYARETGEPLSRVTGAAGEMIVWQICLSDANCAVAGSKAYAHALPFGLRFGDSGDLVSQTLGVAPRRQQPSGYLPDHHSRVRFHWTYWVGDAVVLAKLTESLTLAAVYVWPLDRMDRLARERDATLDAESAHIDPANAAAVEALRAAIPTPRWRESMEDGDELFTDAIITQATALLEGYLDEVGAATTSRSAPGIFEATQRLVLALNELNAATGSIETLERDELGVFMDRVVRATGFRLQPGEDFTFHWREW